MAPTLVESPLMAMASGENPTTSSVQAMVSENLPEKVFLGCRVRNTQEGAVPSWAILAVFEASAFQLPSRSWAAPTLTWTVTSPSVRGRSWPGSVCR